MVSGIVPGPTGCLHLDSKETLGTPNHLGGTPCGKGWASVRIPWPEHARGLEQAAGADHIRLDEGVGPRDRAIDVAFSDKMDERCHTLLAQQLLDKRCVANVTGDEVSLLDIGNGRTVAGISQAIEHDDRIVGMLLAPVAHEVAANEADTASNKHVSQELFLFQHGPEMGVPVDMTGTLDHAGCRYFERRAGRLPY